MNKNQIKPIAVSKKELEDVLLKIKEANPIPSPRITFKPNTIILLHGFNSGPGNKEKVIAQYLTENNLQEDYLLIAPQLDGEPRAAIRQINQLIRQHKTGKVHLIGTSLGGFYANYFRAKFKDNSVVVHVINPSWNPSKSLLGEVNKLKKNFKTKEEWVFNENYIDQLAEFEEFINDNLKMYRGKNYTIHLAVSDELLSFDDFLSYIEKYQVPNEFFHYDTNHRFEKMEEFLGNIFQK
jgi:uncharacterized protein